MSRKIGITLILLGALTLATLGPTAYSRYLDPLARLRFHLAEGRTYTNTYARFAAFADAHPEAVLTHGYTLHHLLKGPVPKVHYVFLHRSNLFHELYLQVLFDEQDRAQEIAFLVD